MKQKQGPGQILVWRNRNSGKRGNRTRSAFLELTPVAVQYDLRPKLGFHETRYWAIANIPNVADDGFVRWSVNRAQDVTALALLRARHA